MPGRTRRAASDYGRPPFGAAALFVAGRTVYCRAVASEWRWAFLLGGGVASRDGTGTAAGLSAAVFFRRSLSPSLWVLFSQLRPFFRRGHHRSAVVFASLLPGDAAEQGRPERGASDNGTAASPLRGDGRVQLGQRAVHLRHPPGMEANGACLQSAVRGAVHRRGLRRCGACRSAPRWAIRRRFRP